MDYYIKTTDEKTLWESLESVGLAYKQYDREDPLNIPTGHPEWVPTGQYIWVPRVQLDVIGTIQVATGEMGSFEGREFPIMENIEGFHANLRGQLTEEQQSALPLIDAPATPVRVWA